MSGCHASDRASKVSILTDYLAEFEDGNFGGNDNKGMEWLNEAFTLAAQQDFDPFQSDLSEALSKPEGRTERVQALIETLE